MKRTKTSSTTDVDKRTKTKMTKINLYKSLTSSKSLELEEPIEMTLTEERFLFENLRDEYLTDDIDYEVCGIININENKEFIIDKFTKGNSFSCNQRNNTIIFHTHPNKIYPSVEDIVKVLRYDDIKISYIISKEGFFKIGYDSGISIDKKDIDIQEIEQHVQQYYFMDGTYKGRTYNKSSMNKYTKGFTRFMKETYPEFFMKFYVFI